MSKIEQTFKTLQAENKKALITFLSACDPDYETSLEIIKSLPTAGVDIIEIGMPFTDPAAEGITIQKANQRALKAGGCMDKTLQIVREFRKNNTETPIVLMGYANPLMAYGFEKFIEDTAQAGIDGLIIVDMPAEEDEELRKLAAAKDIDIIRLLTPTSDENRLPKLLEGVSGFLYYVSITGITGTASADHEAIKPHIEQIKQHSDLPIAIGFGIKTPDDARTMGEIAEGVVVGSAIVKEIEDGPASAKENITEKIKALKAALG